MAKKTLRLATAEDSSSLLDIYAPFILETPVTFEYDLPSIQEFGRRISIISERYPWIVCLIDDFIAGYAYASQHSERAAYQWSVNSSVYIKDEYQRKGIANALYLSLFELLQLLGYFTAYAVITYPNMKSENFHKSLGFKPIGIYNKAGYKSGKWHDVIWYQLPLKDYPDEPEKPLLIKNIDTAIINEILKRNTELIKI